MIKKTAALFIIFFCLFHFVFGETNGYLSFEYSRDLRNAESKIDSFQNFQLGLVFSGNLSPGIGYMAEVRFQKEDIEVDHVLLSFFSVESFQLKMGLFLVPFGNYNRYGRPYENLLVNIPLNISLSYPSRWREIGILVEGQIGRIGYALFAGNGLAEGVDFTEGQQFLDNNSNKGIGGRLGWLLGQNFELAYSYYRGKVDPDNQRNTILQSVDLNWTTQDFMLLGEYTQRIIDNPAEYSKGETKGIFVQASFPWQKIHPVISYQKLSYNDAFHGLGYVHPLTTGSGIELDQNRWAFGIVFIPRPNVLIKAEYDLNKDILTDIKKTTIILQAALSF